jgi:hypothetical protein
MGGPCGMVWVDNACKKQSTLYPSMGFPGTVGVVIVRIATAKGTERCHLLLWRVLERDETRRWSNNVVRGLWVGFRKRGD